MKIAVFHCPAGITGEGALEAFFDAGLSLSYLKKELNQKILDKKIKHFVLRSSKALAHAKIFGREALDALPYVAAITAALGYFKIQKCFVRRLAIGKKGNPRTLKLLRGFILDRLAVNQELVTPAGAIILSLFCEKEEVIPSMKLEAVGEGAGEIQVSVGETIAPFYCQRILILETNLDDMNPQGFELLYERLFKAGALDVWVEPILMKKMRPAYKLSVLMDHKDRERISEVVFRETPSLGVRFLEVDRLSLPRRIVRFKTRFGSVRMKIGFLNSCYAAARPEYEDVRRISEERSLPFRRVYEACLADWSRSK